MGQEELSRQEFTHKVKEVIQPGENQLEDLGSNISDSQEMARAKDEPITLEEEDEVTVMEEPSSEALGDTEL